jgi:hypothetical protein
MKFFSEQREAYYTGGSKSPWVSGVNNENPSAFSGPIRFDLPVPARLA